MNMRKNNNRNMKHRGGQGGRRYQGGGGGGGNRNNDGQNIARQKHHATQQREKYNNLARDAQNNGDRVDVEYYLQHVDHYNRVLTDIAAVEAERFAHQREQLAQHQDANAGTAEGATDGATGGEDAAGGDTVEPISTGGNQPRMTRHHHRRHQHQNQQQAQAPQEGGSGNEGGSGEIPLPGSVLPQI